MRTHVAALLLSSFASACASGGITPRAREVEALRSEVDVLTERAERLEAELAAAREQADQTLADHQRALQAKLVRLQGELAAVVATLEASQPGPDATELAEADATDGGSKVVGAGAPKPRPARKEKPSDEDPTPEPIEDPAGRVRALMADVAARLQVASESVDDDRQSQTRLGRARQLLVEADRAASKKDFSQAESLAQDAAELIADAMTQAGAGQP